jgi:hypothetical protein
MKAKKPAPKKMKNDDKAADMKMMKKAVKKDCMKK